MKCNEVGTHTKKKNTHTKLIKKKLSYNLLVIDRIEIKKKAASCQAKHRKVAEKQGPFQKRKWEDELTIVG